jgi:hypothetical protein
MIATQKRYLTDGWEVKVVPFFAFIQKQFTRNAKKTKLMNANMKPIQQIELPQTYNRITSQKPSLSRIFIGATLVSDTKSTQNTNPNLLQQHLIKTNCRKPKNHSNFRKCRSKPFIHWNRITLACKSKQRLQFCRGGENDCVSFHQKNASTSAQKYEDAEN